MTTTAVARVSITNPSHESIAANIVLIEGRRVAFERSGSGTPIVILETGLGAESVEWARVQLELEKSATVLRYDRAGRGASERAPTPRVASQMVDDLRKLLDATETSGPYVLVGHSFGGLLMRLFAQRFRPEVVGLVLVDSLHDAQFEVFGALFPPPTQSDPKALMQLRAFWTDGWRNTNSTTEGIDLVRSIAEDRAVTSFGDLPLHVVTAGTFINETLGPPHIRTRLQQHWEDLQKRFLNLSSRAEQSFVPKSGHFVQRDAPEAVVAAVRTVVAQASSM
jgi:pimeloyl-ACP methyl ester carboxylesterase